VTRLLRCLVAVAVAAVVMTSATSPTEGFALLNSKWPNGQVVMHLRMGGGSGTLSDGSTSWNQVMTNGLAAWNAHIQLVSFSAVNDSTAANGDGNGINTVFFSDTVYGEAFEENVLAVATSWSFSGGRKAESDVIFNRNEAWNSYRGNRRSGATDILRVALHEFGHTLGLDHPDEAGQNVDAIMNSRISNRDSLAADDINGARSLYGSGVTSNVTFPPRNETADFVTRLGALYRDELRSPGFATYVDPEGAGVWTPEYARFRVGQCNHETASQRVFQAITDGIASGVCALTPAGAIPFPPRNEGLQFFVSLNGLYRDTLRRSQITSFVDEEGLVVWILEYLRYRLNGCGHEVAVQKVFMQIRGQGIQPTC
jgi:hypothetical protein